MMKIEKLSFKALGTDIDLQIVVENEKESLLAQKDLAFVRQQYEKIEQKFSRFDEKSELSDLNRNIGEFKNASPEMISIAQKAILYNEITDGFFDSRVIENLESIGYDKTFDLVKSSEEQLKNDTVGFHQKLSEDISFDGKKICFKKRMDFSGVVKGYATDKMTEFLAGKGWKNFLVDSGGDMYFVGFGIDGKKWRIDVEGIPEKSLMFELSGQGIATSGIGRRKWERNGKRLHHLVNPQKPEDFSFDLQSVSVIENMTEKADVWAKTLFLLGLENAKKMAEDKNIACVILEYSGRAWISSEAKKYIFAQ